jgi:hypothetical protein
MRHRLDPPASGRSLLGREIALPVFGVSVPIERCGLSQIRVFAGMCVTRTVR